MRRRVPNCGVVICAIDVVCPRKRMMMNAHTGAMRKRRNVAVIWDTFFRTTFENEVELPHIAPAETAMRAAMMVALSFEKFMLRFLKVTKYEPMMARSAQKINLREIFSFNKRAATMMAQIGCNCCRRETTEN